MPTIPKTRRAARSDDGAPVSLRRPSTMRRPAAPLPPAGQIRGRARLGLAPTGK